MFQSFFPKPKLLLASAILFAILAAACWYTLGEGIAARIGAGMPPEDTPPVIGLGYFATRRFLWFYAYTFACCAAFAAVWFHVAPHRWQWWSIVGTMAIIASSYFSVQVSVALNVWRGPFFDAIQNALSGKSTVTAGELYGLLWVFTSIAFLAVALYVATKFLVSHYVFRWRTAMNDYYMARWPDVRTIEGAAQRVQEDTMRFATIVEDLGVTMVESLMTLFAFLPVLYALSKHVTELPIVGHVAAPLVFAALFWSAFGTVLLAVAGIKLPGLYFLNQRFEAAYRKELVYGEDDARRAGPPAVAELFANVRANYFRLYFHYAYFNIFRSMYLQADAVFSYVLLIPTLVAGKITLGIMQQIQAAFTQVATSFQYLVNSWTTIIELLSIHKRLLAFERSFEGRPLPEIECAPADHTEGVS